MPVDSFLINKIYLRHLKFMQSLIMCEFLANKQLLMWLIYVSAKIDINILMLLNPENSTNKQKHIEYVDKYLIEDLGKPTAKN